MGVDWEFLRSSASDSTNWSNEEFEEVYQNLSSISKLRSRDKTIEKLELIFNLSQLIMVAKWDQANALKEEIKKLADSAGRLDAHRERELLEEIERLERLLESGPSATKDSKMDEQSFPYDWSREWKAKKQELEEKLIQKNCEIEQLIENLSRNEADKARLEHDVTNLQSQLSMASSEMNAVAAECQSLKRKIAAAEEKAFASEKQLASLDNRNRELKHKKNEQERKHQELESQIDDRVDKLAIVIKEKDEEISKLKKEIYRKQPFELGQDRDKTCRDEIDSVINQLRQTLEKREAEIDLLTQNLSKATKEIDKNTELISTLKRSRRSIETAESEEIQKLRSELHGKEFHIKRLEHQLVSAEDDAQVQAQDLYTVLSELKSYMRGEYSLADAVADLKETRHQLRLRDSEIEELTSATNQLQINVNSLLDENMELRDQLQLEPSEDIDLSGIKKTDWKNSKQIIEKMTTDIYKLQEEKNSLRATIYELTRNTSNLQHALDEARAHQTDNVDAGQSESIREQIRQLHLAVVRLTQQQVATDGQETMQLLKDKCLRLEGEVSALEKALRDKEEEEVSSPPVPELSEFDPETFSRRNMKALRKVLKHLPLSTEESLAKLKTQVMFLLEEVNRKDTKVVEGKSHLSAYKSQFESLLSQVAQLNDKILEDEGKLEAEMASLKESEGQLAAKKVALESQVTELKIYIDQCNVNTDQATNQLALRNAENKYEYELSKRMIEVYRKEMDLLQEKVRASKENLTGSFKKIKELQNELIQTTERHSQIVNEMKRKLANSVSTSAHNAMHIDLAITTAKYRSVLSNQLLFTGEIIERNVLEMKIKYLTKANENMEDQLTEAKQKISSLQNSLSMVTGTSVPVDTKIDLLSRQLAAVEQRELSTMQRAEHENKTLEVAQKECAAATKRLQELENAHRKLISVNQFLQEKEVKLENQVATNSSSQIEKLERDIESLTKQKDEATLEARRLEMLLGVHQTQLNHYIQKWKATEADLNQIRRMQEDLATLSEERAQIAILHLELSKEKSMNSELSANLEEVKQELEQTIVALSRNSSQMEEREKEFSRCSEQQNKRAERLMIIIKDLRIQFTGAVPLLELERMSNLLEDLRLEKSCLESNLEVTKRDRREARLLLQEMKVKQENLDDFVNVLNSSPSATRTVADWSRKLEEVRLKNVHLKQKLLTLEEEDLVNRKLLEVKEERCSELQQRLASLETLWVEQQTNWEEQLFMSDNAHPLQPSSEADKPLMESSSRSTSVDIASILESKLKLRDQEIILMKEKNEVASEQLMTLELELQRFRALGLQLRSEPDSPKTPPELRDARSDIIIHGLKERIKLSEDALTSSRNSLKQQQDEQQEEKAHFKSEIGNLHSEKSELERKIRNLQADLDDIPVRNTSGYKVSAQQMEIDSLQETISSMEKRLDRGRQERLALEDSVSQLERELSVSKRERTEERQHLEVACEIKIQQMNRERDRLNRQVRELQDDKDAMQRELRSAEDGAIKSPSLILKTLVEKLRDKLIEKEKEVSDLKKSFQEMQAQDFYKDNDDPSEEKPARDFDRSFQEIEPIVHKPELIIQDPEVPMAEVDDVEMQKLQLANQGLKEKLKQKDELEKIQLKQITDLKDQVNKAAEKVEVVSRSNKVQLEKEKEIAKLKKEKQELTKQLDDILGKSPEAIVRTMDVLTKRLESLGEIEYLEKKKERDDEIKKSCLQWENRKKLEKDIDQLKERVSEATRSLEDKSKQLETSKELLKKFNKEKFHLKSQITKLNKVVTEKLCGVCFRNVNSNDLNRTYTIEPTPVEVVQVEECGKCNSWAKANAHLESRLKDSSLSRKKLLEVKNDVEKRLAEAMEEIAALRHHNERLKDNLKDMQEGKPLIKTLSVASKNVKRTAKCPSELPGTTVVLNYEQTIADLQEELRQKTHLLTYSKNVIENAKTREETLLKEQQKLHVKISILQSVRDETDQAKLVAELREAKLTICRLHEELQSRSDS